MTGPRTWRLGALLATLALPAAAGTVYVPLALNADIAGTRYRTQVWVTNAGSAQARLDAVFLETGASGLPRAGRPSASFEVAPGAITLVTPTALEGKNGMLEITGPDTLHVEARLSNGGIGAPIPVVSSDDLVAAGGTAHLVALERARDRFSSVGLLNLGKTDARCTARVARANGRLLGGEIQITLPPLSHRQYDDVLLVLGGASVSAARAAISCDQPFFAYALVLRPGGELAVVAPARSLRSTLTRPGAEPAPGPAQCAGSPAGVRCFEQTGVFFEPTRELPTKRIVLPFPNKVEYKKARVQIDVTHGGWYPAKPDGIHNIFWLAQGTNPDRIGYLNVRGPDRHLVYAVHHIGAPASVEARRLGYELELEAGRTYRFEYTFDAQNQHVEFVVRDAQGHQLLHDTDNTTFTRRIFTRNQDYLIDFGLHDEAADSPTFGWKYANLKVEFFQ
jgi:hypothetical protein